jgi:hypothetical protein
VKRFAAILSAVLLVYAQFVPAQAVASCAGPAMNCSGACRQMPCCAAKPSSNPQPSPAVPAQSSAQNQISLFAPSVVAWTLPENLTGSKKIVSASPLPVMAAPLYARNCALLL